MKIVISFLFLLFYSIGYSQTSTDSVKQTIQLFFEGMRSSNRTLLMSSLADSALLQTIAKDKLTGIMKIKNEPIQNFVEQVSKMPIGAADEQIVFDVIRIDGDLASVWTPYKFYFNGAFSHCGVNSFQMVRLNGHWKIQYIIDTRRKNGCIE